MQDFLQRLQRLQARYEPEKAQPQSNIQPEQTGPVQLQTVNYPGQQTLPASEPAQNQFMQRMAALENKYEGQQPATLPPVNDETPLPGITQEPGQVPTEPEFYGPPQDVNRGAEAGIAAALEYLAPGAFTDGELNKDLSLGQKAKLSLARSSANVILEPAAMLLSLAGKDKEANVARRMLKAAGKKTALPEFEKEFDMSDLVDPDFWATKGTSLVPPLLALIPVSMAGASAGVGAGAALGLGRLGQTIFGAVGGSLLGTPAEALMEAAQKYEQIYEETGDKQKAANAAADVAKANMLLLSGSNAFETALALTGGKKFKIAKKVLTGIKKAPKPIKKAILSYVPGAAAFVTAGLSEGAEESFQGEFQRVYGGEENENGFNIKVFTERMKNMTPEEREQFVLGAIMGVIFQGAGTLTRDEIRRANKILSDEKTGADLKQKAQSDLIAIAAKEAQEKGISVEDLLWSAVVGKKQLAKAGDVAKDIERLKGGEKYRGSAPAQEQRPAEEPAAGQIAGAELDAGLQGQPEEKASQKPDEAQVLIDDILAEDVSQQVETEPGEQPALATPRVEKQQQSPEITPQEEIAVVPVEQGESNVKSNIDEDNTPEPVKEEIAKQDKKVASSKVYDVNVSDIDTDTDRFQNRAAEFSEKTAATIAERYDENLFDPIVLWKDPENGKNYVLSGHSRLEGMKRRNAKNIPARFFQGSEEDAVKFAKLEANRLGAAENLAETINAYREAKAQKLSKKRMVDLFDGDTNWLDSAININPKGDFVRVLSQPGEVASEFPYIKRFARWVGDLRGKYKGKLTNRHEQQLFDFLYKGDKRNRDIQKDDFYNLVESQINRTDFNQEQPLVLKRNEKIRTGTKARKDTAQLEEQLDQLRSDLARARTDAERDAIQGEITRVSDAVKDIVRAQGDLFAQTEVQEQKEESKREPKLQQGRKDEIEPKEKTTVEKLLRKKEKLEKRLAGIEREIDQARLSSMPGTAITGRSGVSASRIKKINSATDKIVDKSVEWKKLREEIKLINNQISYLKKKPAADAEKAKARTDLQRKFDNIKVGDKIDVGGNELLEVTKKNKKTVVTNGGVKWTVDEIYNIVSSPENVQKELPAIKTETLSQEEGFPDVPAPAKDDKFILYKNGIKGKNNNRLVAYQHIRREGEKYSKYEDGLVAAKVSDFERALQCKICGRNIVHVFWVKDNSGIVYPYGREHLDQALGLPKPVSKADVDKMIAELNKKQEQVNAIREQILSRAQGAKTIDEVNKRFSNANRGLPLEELLKTSVFADKDGNKIRVREDNDEMKNILIDEGFTEIIKAGERVDLNNNKLETKTEKTPAGEQTSFKPKPEVPEGKIKPKKEQKQVEGAGGVGLFKKDAGRRKEQSLFVEDEGLSVENFERGGKKYERVKFRDATKAEIGSPKRRQKIVADMPERAGWEKTYLTKEKAFYYVRKAPDELVREEGADYGLVTPDKIFYSKLEKVLKEKLPGKGTPESMLQAIRGFMKKGDFKKDEYEWLGLEEWLQEQKDKVTKDDVIGFVRAHNVAAETTTLKGLGFDENGFLYVNNTELAEPYTIYELLNDFNFSQQDLKVDGKEYDKNEYWDGEIAISNQGYFYLVLSKSGPEIIRSEAIEEFSPSEIQEQFSGGPRFKDIQIPGGKNYREVFITASNVDAAWKDGHDAYDEIKNPIVRIRASERESIDGDKVFFLDELQEPREHQLAKAPDWVKKYGNEIGMKYAIRYAAENGFDRVAWTTGEKQADRYDLRKKVKSITLRRKDNASFAIDGETVAENAIFPAQESVNINDLEDHVGKDIAKQAVDIPVGKSREFTGDDLAIGGEKLKKFYDRMLPSFVKKYTKKWGAKVEPIQISTKPTERVYDTGIEPVKLPDGYGGFILSQINADKGDYEYWDGNNWVVEKTDAKVFDYEKEAREELVRLNKGYVTVHSVNITPEMRESVLKGQPLFERKKGYETRKGEENQEKIGRKEIKRLEVGYNRGKRGILLANGIAEDFKRSGATELVGKTVNTPDELAVMAQVYRNPSFETLRYFFVKGNKIVHAIGVSSRLPGATAGYPDGLYGDDGIRWLKQQVKKAGADKLYILHNHPSGHVRPSKNDMSFTQRIQKNIKEYSGHIVINHGKYAVIDESAKSFSEKEIADIIKRDDPLTKPSKPHVLIGEQVGSSNDLAEIGFSLNVQKGWYVLIGRSADGRVRGLMEIPETLPRNKIKFMAQVRSFARKTGSMQAALVVGKLGPDAKLSSLLADYIRTGLLLDVVDYSGVGMLGSVVDGMPVVKDESYDMGRRFDENKGKIVKERQAKYGYNDPIAYAGKLLYDNGMRDKAKWTKAMVKKFGENNTEKIKASWPGDKAVLRGKAGRDVKQAKSAPKEKPTKATTSRKKPASSKAQRATFIERPKEGLQASYFGTRAYTKEGAKLIHRIKKDKTGKKYNIRSVVDYLNDALGVEMRVGNEQLQGKTVAAYYSDPLHLYRTRAGDGIWNFHELGHAAANILAKSNKAYGRFLNQYKAELIALTEADDSFASAATPHEGFAEIFMNIIVAPDKSKSKLSVALERLLKTETPELYKSVLDARAAFNEHMKRPITVRWHSKLAPIKPEPLHKRAQQLYHWFMYKAFSAEFAPIQRIESPIYAKIAKISRKTANIVHKQAIAPVKSSGHMLWHIPTEVARAVYGGGKSRQGVRIYIDPKDFSQMSSDELALFEEYGIKLPENAKNGDVLYLTDFTWGDIIKAVGKGKWNAFEEYAQAKAAIDRLEKKNFVYPGMADDAPPDALREMIAEAERDNPDWPEQFNRANEFMNRLLLINILSGEIQASEYKRIVDAYDYYVPLPRDVERGIKRMGQSGGKLWSGLARAKGSPARFTPLSEAVEQRVRLTMSSYFHNRLRSQIVRMAEDIAAMDGIPDEAKRAAARVMVPLKLDLKKVATLSSDEMKKVIADYLNEIQKKEFGEDAELIKPSNINLSLPGRPIYRAVDPNAVNVVTRWEPGKGLLFYQVEDPIMYDFMTRTKDVPKTLRFFTELARDVLRPWKQSITHFPVFVAWNIERDAFTSSMLGEGKERFILGGAMGVGLVNRIMGKKGMQEARSDAELLSMSLEHTLSSDHRLASNAFMDVLKEGIWVPGYRRMSLSDKIKIAPGQFSFMLAKLFELINWITGFRALAQSSETVTREGAFVLAKKRGASDEQARYEFDMISGNFISQPGSAVLASIYRAGGFFNPAIQVIGQTIDRGTNPRTRSEFWAVTMPYMAFLGAIMAATAYLLMDEEEREDWRELDDETRLRYFPIKVPGLPVIRAPFDYGPVGAVSSFGFNKVMGALTESPTDNSKMASAMLKRAADMPGLLDIMLITPHGKTFFELKNDYSFFYGRSIRPAWMKTYYQDTPELQAYTSTPEIYRRIGKQIEKSPIMVEYAMRNLLGTSGSELIRITEQIERMGLKDAFTESPAYEKPFIGRLFWRPTVGYSSRSVKELGDAARKFEIAKIRLKKLKDANPDSKKVQKLVQQYKAHEKAALYFKKVRAIGKEINKLRKDKTRSRDKEIDQLAKRMREYAKEALSAIEKAKK